MSQPNVDRSAQTSQGGAKQDVLFDPNKWLSKYDQSQAKNQIRVEAAYLIILLFICPGAMLYIWVGGLADLLELKEALHQNFMKYALSWVGGTLGGTLFSIKWLYHSVAKYEWIQDRLLWRLLTPHLSGSLSFAIITLISSGIMQIFDQNALNVPSTVIGLSFLCGYFSDNAIAKMTDVADTLFGTLNTKRKNSVDRDL